jgi:putative spermidine/putrescine transport system ATP-binding protein
MQPPHLASPLLRETRPIDEIQSAAARPAVAPADAVLTPPAAENRPDGRAERRPADLRLEAVSKAYAGGVTAVDTLDLEVRAGEFFSLLGPSGCGKTTTLRLIAGFERASAGRIHVAGRDVTALAAHRRQMGVVFQNYALFPHRTVADNVAFGLRMRRRPAAEIRTRVADALALVALEGLAERWPRQLSGGQQQRVALARALVIEPPVLLCDEPFGALDRRLRQQMQGELKELQRRLAVTLVFVTHDQEEALAMSDRLAVMNEGRIEQLGTPAEIYDRPRTRFVAGFIGEANIFEGRLASVGPDRGRLVTIDGLALEVPLPAGRRVGDGCAVAVRPERLRIAASAGERGNRLSGVVEETSFLGGNILYRTRLTNGRRLLVQEPNDGMRAIRPPGTAMTSRFEPVDAVPLDD